MKTSKETLLVFLMVFCTTIFLQPLGIATKNYIQIGPNVKQKATNNEGPVLFESTVRASARYFSSGYVYFSDLYFPGGYSLSSVGFKCGSNSNITVSKIENSELRYVVNAEKGQTSTSRVMLPSNKRFSSVEGATSWTYSSNLLTVNVDHESLQEIIVSFSTTIPNVSMMFAYVGPMFGLISIVMVSVCVLLAVRGELTMPFMLATAFIIIGTIVVAMVIVSFYNVFYG